MHHNDWKQAYGRPTEEFHDRLCQTLDGLTEHSRAHGRKKAPMLLVAILILALLAGVAIAVSQLSLLKNLYFDQPPMENSAAILTNLEAGISSDMLSASVEEALFDGKALLLTVRYRLKDMQRFYFGESFVTIGSELSKPNATPLYPWPPSVFVNGSEDSLSGDWQIEPDGSMLYYANALLDVPENTQSIHVRIQNHLGGELNMEDIELDVNVSTDLRHAILQPVDGAQGERFSIVSAELTLNPVLSYLDVEYSYQQADEGEEMGIVIWVYDVNGEKIEEVNLSAVLQKPLENGNFYTAIGLPYFKELPETLYLEAKVIGETASLGRIQCQVIPQ